MQFAPAFQGIRQRQRRTTQAGLISNAHPLRDLFVGFVAPLLDGGKVQPDSGRCGNFRVASRALSRVNKLSHVTERTRADQACHRSGRSVCA